ncbi:MAG TPA: branched-chain amino acid ABC transporter permease [Dehalococcoidia bacterium]|nr:branched-chain amino acid ABC transporter permease [Dehalococcoidia bacterium]
MSAFRVATPKPLEVATVIFLAVFVALLSSSAWGFVLGGAAGLGALAVHRLLQGRNLAPDWAWYLMWLGLAAGMPFIVSGEYRLAQLATMGYLAIVLLGLVALGQAGQLSVGHSAFVGIGAYAAAVAVKEWDVPFVVAGLFAVAFAALIGLLTGVAALRLHGPYLAIATLGLAIVFQPILKLEELREWTGGRTGINMFARTFVPFSDWDWLTETRWYYYLTLLLLVGLLLLSHNLLQSAMGRAFKAVRDDETAAAAIGVNVAAVKLSAFVVSAIYAAIGGMLLFLLSNRFLSADNFTLLMSIELVMVLILGGMTSLKGAFLGAFLLVFVYREGLETVARQTEQGLDTWLLLLGSLLGCFLLLGRPAVKQALARYLDFNRVLSTFGPAVLCLAGAVGIGVGFTALVRLVAEHVELTALRPTVAGAFLIVAILSVPYGLAGLIDYLGYMSWGQLKGVLLRLLRAEPREAAVAERRMPPSYVPMPSSSDERA